MAQLRDRGDKVYIVDNEDVERFSVDDEGDVVVSGTLTVDGATTQTGALTVAAAFTASSTSTLSGDVTISDAVDVVLATTTGTKIGTATSQKLGFWNATPADQPSAYTQTYSTANKTHANLTSAAVGTVAAATGAAQYGYTTPTQADAIVTAINALRDDVTDVKQLANSIIDDLQEIGLVG